jgi:hypothetical protein
VGAVSGGGWNWFLDRSQPIKPREYSRCAQGHVQLLPLSTCYASLSHIPQALTIMDRLVASSILDSVQNQWPESWFADVADQLPMLRGPEPPLHSAPSNGHGCEDCRITKAGAT